MPLRAIGDRIAVMFGGNKTQPLILTFDINQIIRVTSKISRRRRPDCVR